MLADVWTKWFEGRPKNCRDSDGLELLRAERLLSLDEEDGLEFIKRSAKHKKVFKEVWGVAKPIKTKFKNHIASVLVWLKLIYPVKGIVDYQLAAAEKICQLVPQAEIDYLLSEEAKKASYYRTRDFRDNGVLAPWLNVSSPLDKLSKSQFVRLWEIKNWMDKPHPDATRHPCDIGTLTKAFEMKLCNIDDIADALVGPDRGGLLLMLTQRKLGKKTQAFLKKHKPVAKLIEAIRERVLDIELHRGEKPTLATQLVSPIGALWGTDTLMCLLAGLGKSRLSGSSYRSATKAQSLTDLIGRTFPASDDTPANFSKEIKRLIKDGIIAEERVLELAFFAPQWAAFVQQHLKWPGMLEAIYWFFAHMQYVWGAGDKLVAGTQYDEDDADADRRNQTSSWERLILELSLIHI